MSRGGESGSSSSSISSCPKFSLLTASSLGRLTLGAGETHTLGRNRGLPHLAPHPCGATTDILRRSPSLSASGASCLFLAPPRFPEGPSGEQGAAASPPAMASSNVGRTLSLRGDGASVPAGEKMHSKRLRAAVSP